MTQEQERVTVASGRLSHDYPRMDNYLTMAKLG